MGSSRDFLDLLRNFFSRDGLDTAYPLLENPGLLDVVHAWERTRVVWDIPEILETVPDNKSDQWELMWSFCQWDEMDLAMTSGKTPFEALQLFTRAKSLYLIYPNGRISPAAKQILALRVSEEISKGIEAAERIKEAKSGSKGND